MQETAPPVLVFAENKRDVDAIHEFLLVKGVEAVAIHGDKEQEERARSFDEFKRGEKDVLVATDIASKVSKRPCPRFRRFVTVSASCATGFMHAQGWQWFSSAVNSWLFYLSDSCS